MSDGSIHWYRKAMNAAEIGDQLRRFGELGLALENGDTHRITRLDLSGDQVPTDRQALIAELAVAADVSFQLWLAGTSSDVYCRFRRPSDSTMVQTYGLDGLTVEERRQVRMVVWDALGRSLAATEALIVDILDRTDELVDWDAAVSERRIPTVARPDLVVMRSSSQDLGEFQIVSVD
jgi:hypothetical protein